MPRRRPGTLLPLEVEILETLLRRRGEGDDEVHGFGLARAMREQTGSRALTAHGTLYKALGRLEESGFLASRWEDPAAAEGRPRRRLYSVTDRGAEAARRARSDAPRARPVTRVAGTPA